LVLAVSHPNLPQYRMSPKKSKILKENVEELLRKEWIQRSLNPCVIPSLLTLKKDSNWDICKDNCIINKIIMSYKFSITRWMTCFRMDTIIFEFDLGMSER